jgi:hypothetical protein
MLATFCWNVMNIYQTYAFMKVLSEVNLHINMIIKSLADLRVFLVKALEA